MHRGFRSLLKNATGSSEFVIAENIDIRGFSSFTDLESTQTAMFIKKVYKRLIDEYIPDDSFFKPTGDGLLVVIPYVPDKNVKKVVRTSVEKALDILNGFSSFCDDDPDICFDVPKTVGIGMSRGPACRLVSHNKTLDYSGKPLNLASRLMDLARPSGIVFDKSMGIRLLPGSLAKQFSKAIINIRGIDEGRPTDIYRTKQVLIPTSGAQRLKPIRETGWRTKIYRTTLRHIKNFSGVEYPLPSEPRDPKQIVIELHYKSSVPGTSKNAPCHFEITRFKYYKKGGKPKVYVAGFDGLSKKLENYGVKNAWTVTFKIMYLE